jgi:hypothetical protein
MLRGFVLGLVVAVALIFVGIQFVPYGHDHRNPPVRQEPNWDSPRTRELAVRACFDCHSNASVWPWYSYVAPASWVLRADIDYAHREMNLSRWDQPQPGARNAVDQVQQGDMPLPLFTLVHPEARLSPTERAELIQGLDATMAASGYPQATPAPQRPPAP